MCPHPVRHRSGDWPTSLVSRTHEHQLVELVSGRHKAHSHTNQGEQWSPVQPLIEDDPQANRSNERGDNGASKSGCKAHDLRVAFNFREEVVSQSSSLPRLHILSQSLAGQHVRGIQFWTSFWTGKYLTSSALSIPRKPFAQSDRTAWMQAYRASASLSLAMSVDDQRMRNPS